MPRTIGLRAIFEQSEYHRHDDDYVLTIHRRVHFEHSDHTEIVLLEEISSARLRQRFSIPVPTNIELDDQLESCGVGATRLDVIVRHDYFTQKSTDIVPVAKYKADLFYAGATKIVSVSNVHQFGLVSNEPEQPRP